MVDRLLRTLLRWLHSAGGFIGTLLGTLIFPILGSLIGGMMGAFVTAFAYELLHTGLSKNAWELAWAAAPASVVVAAVAAFAIVGSLAADRWLLRPAGPFFPIFALGAVALGPVEPARPDQALGICVCAAVCAIASINT